MIYDINFTPKVNPENKYTNAQMTEKYIYIYIIFSPRLVNNKISNNAGQHF